MSERDTRMQLARVLDEVSELFPGDPAWRDLATRVRTAPTQTADQGEPARRDKRGEPRPIRSACACCDGLDPLDEHGLCEACGKLYGPESSRVVDGPCACGHPPAGPVVFAYRAGHGGETFCSTACVAEHFRGAFGFFWRKLV